MRPSPLPIIALLVLAAPAAWLTAADTVVDAVTVYLDRAYVTRIAELPLKTGPAEIVLDGFPDELEEPSLRLALPEGVRLEHLHVRRVLVEEQQAPDEHRRLAAELAGLEAERAVLVDRQRLASGRQAALDRIFEAHLAASQRKLGEMPAIADWGALDDFLGERRQALAAELREVATEQRRVEEAHTVRSQALALGKAEEQIYRRQVVVHLTALRDGPAAVRVSYLVPGALWYPAYDLRADEDRQGMELVYAAFVQNATGEDWRDAAITLAAAKPLQAVLPPAVASWRVDQANGREQQRQQKGLELQQMDHQLSPVQMSSSSGIVSGISSMGYQNQKCYNPDQNLCWQADNRANGQVRSAHQALLRNVEKVASMARSIEQRRTSVIFTAARRATVVKDGKAQRLILDSRHMDLDTVRYAVPDSSAETFYSGRFVNAFPLPLLPGRAQIFIGPDLIGGTDLSFIAGGEQASVYLGVDEQVRVHRILDPAQSSHEAGRSWSRLEVRWRYEVESFHAEPVTVRIDEALPTSKDDEIRVRIRELSESLEPDQAGLLRWTSQATPGRHEVATLHYQLEWRNERRPSGIAEIIAEL